MLGSFTRYIFLILALLVTTMVCAAEPQKETVFLYTYHNKPPFIVDIDAEQGLYYDLAYYLNTHSSEYEFVVTYLPRKRINSLIKNAALKGVVLGVVPAWFNDKSREKFLWLSTFYDDKDEFISLKSTPFEYSDASSFNGKSFAGVAGYYYFGVNESVASGAVKRIDTSSENQILKLVDLKRADFGIVSQSTLKYLQRTNQLADHYHLSDIPHDSFSRAAFVMRNNVAFYNYLEKIFATLEDNPEWQAILSMYE